MKKILVSLTTVLLLGTLLTGAALAANLTGAGATFPFPIYSLWFDEYHQLHPEVRINYQAIGSGGGVRQITSRTVDFGATDGPMTDQELAAVERKLLHIPTVIGAVSVVYNIPGVPQSGLKLTGEVLADIYLGEITRWNDPRIEQLNPGLDLPNLAIAVIRRADSSGTTFVFTDYLSTADADWASRVGREKSVNWPVGLGGQGNAGVAGLVKQLPGAIGYVEQAYAEQNRLPQAAIQNRAGNFVLPTLEAATLAAAGAEWSDDPHDYRVSIVNPSGKEAYPIASFTWLLVYEDAYDLERGRVLADFLWWAIHDGQKYAPTLGYSPLPADVVERVEATLRTLRYAGTPLLP